MIKSEIIQISDELFLRLGKMITERYGIKMSLEKKIMFQSRLQKRLHELHIQSFDEYAERLLHPDGEPKELELLADYISTNKTEFFRENDHFLFLANQFLPEFLGEVKPHRAQLKIWSAGCSSGEEAYSIAITLEEFMRQKGARFDYSILATDISLRMLRTAKDAIYPLSRIDEISLELRKKYFLRSKDTKNKRVRIIKDLRDKVRPAYHNLVDPVLELDELFDVVFLRNTLIYFDKDTQLKVLSGVIKNLKPGGYLFIGHSESLINMSLPIRLIMPSIYRKAGVE